MKVNENLKIAAGYNPTKQSYQMTTRNLCEKIETNEITLPLYQRDLSWTIKKCVDLFNYQLNGKAPVSPISMNKIKDKKNNTVPQVSFIDRTIINNFNSEQLSVIDGQQRLSTNYLAYVNNSDFRNIVLDLVEGEFRTVDSKFKKHQIPVGCLLNKDDRVFYDYINNNFLLNKNEVQNILFQIRSKLRDYNYTINLAENLTESEQINWFEVLNNAGSRVTRVQMRFAKLKIFNIDVYNDYTRIYKKKLDECNYDLFDMKNTEISIPIANLNSAYELIVKKEHSSNYSPMASDIKDIQICSLPPDQIKYCFKTTLNALDNTLDFIHRFNLSNPKRIDYITYLTGFFVFNDYTKLTEEILKKLKDWYYNVSFSNQSNGTRRNIFNNLLNIGKLNCI